MAKKEKKNENNGILDKNLIFLSIIDIEEALKIRDDKYKTLVKLYQELFEALGIDDSIVFDLNSPDATVETIKEKESLVRSFSLDSRFLTLIQDNEKAMVEIFGKESMQSKKLIADTKAKKIKWGTSKRLNK